MTLTSLYWSTWTTHANSKYRYFFCVYQQLFHYNDVIMSLTASQITSLMIVYSTVYSDTDQRKHQSSASLAFVRWIHRGPVNSPHKGPVTWKIFHLMTSSCIMNTSEFDSVHHFTILTTRRRGRHTSDRSIEALVFPLMFIAESDNKTGIWGILHKWQRRATAGLEYISMFQLHSFWNCITLFKKNGEIDDIQNVVHFDQA